MTRIDPSLLVPLSTFLGSNKFRSWGSLRRPLLNLGLRSGFGSPTIGASVTTPIRGLRSPVVISSLPGILFLGLGRPSILWLVGFGLLRYLARFTRIGCPTFSLSRVLLLVSSGSSIPGLVGSCWPRGLARLARIGCPAFSLSRVLLLVPRCSSIFTWGSAVRTGLSDTVATPASFRGVATNGLLRVEFISSFTSLGGFGLSRRIDAFQIFRRAPWGCRRLG